jgi:hypothetical protein
MKLRTISGAFLVSAFAVACASAPPPTAKLASSEGAVRAAEELNAETDPNARLHLKLARDQLGEAKRLMANGDNDRAAYVLLRAESDADVAIAVAKEERVRKDANEALEQVRKARTDASAPAPMPMETPAPAPTINTIPDSTVPPSVGR